MSSVELIFPGVMIMCQSVILSIGLIGNVLTFVIFSRNRFRNNSISTYCRALSLFNSFTVSQLVFYIVLLFSQVYIYNYSDAICKIFYYLSIGYGAVPAWILVAFSIDKMLSVRTKSRQIRILKNKRFQWSLVAVIFVINALIYIEIPIFLKRTEISPGYFFCDISLMPYFKAMIILILIQTCLIPFIVMSVTSIITIRLLLKSSASIERAGKIDSVRRWRDKKYAVSSLTFNFMFTTLKLPIVVVYIRIAYDYNVDLYFYQCAYFFLFVNASSDFFVHIATNSLFRREFVVLLRIRKERSNTSWNANTNNGNGNLIRLHIL